jgi:hypothetical protein
MNPAWLKHALAKHNSQKARRTWEGNGGHFT